MQALTERIELRLDQRTMHDVDSWRSKQSDEPSRSEAIRRLIDVALGVAGETLQLRKSERLIVQLLLDLLRDPKKRELDTDVVAEAIYGGHYWGLEWEYGALFHGHADKGQVVTDVVNILDMWDFIESACEKLSKEDREKLQAADEHAPREKFAGFDGNNEPHFGVASFMVKTLGRFSRFAKRDLNSHCPVVDSYLRMYAAFEPIRKTLIGHGLSVDQLIKIFQARVHPEYRNKA